jgi:hypothetical protein
LTVEIGFKKKKVHISDNGIVTVENRGYAVKPRKYILQF